MTAAAAGGVTRSGRPQPWRPRAQALRPRLSVSDAILSAGLIAWGVSEAIALPATSPLAAMIAFALVATVPLVWRNEAPTPVLGWTLVIVVIQETIDLLPATGVTPYQTVCLATYALAVSEDRGRLAQLATSAACVAFPWFLLLMDTDDSYAPVHAVATTLVQVAIVVAGSTVRARRAEVRRARDVLRAESRTAPARLAAAIDDERTAIARELRAIVTSNLLEVERLLAQTSSALADGDGVRARRLAEIVQDTAARVVAEMRQLLTALAGAGGSDGAADPAVTEGDPGLARPAARAQWWRDRLADAAVVAPLAVLVTIEAGRVSSPGLALALAALVVVAPVVVRRRWPVAAAAVIGVGLVAREMAGLVPSLPLALMPTLIVGAYAVSAFASDARRARLGMLVLLMGGLTLASLQLDDGGAWPDLAVVLFIVGCSFAAGELVRDNDGRILTLRAGTAELAAEHERRRAAAREDERRRAARELHDVVAHGVSLMAVQAGAAAATAERVPGTAVRAAAAATEALTQTRADLARLADVLGVGAQAPPPGAADLATLVESTRRSGQVVDLTVDGAIASISAEVGVSLYRIVQESLTNARKHARGAATTVEVQVVRAAALAGAGAETVELRVETAAGGAAAALPGTGRGVAGMQERARLLGGSLEAAPTASGGFLVRAQLPVR